MEHATYIHTMPCEPTSLSSCGDNLFLPASLSAAYVQTTHHHAPDFHFPSAGGLLQYPDKCRVMFSREYTHTLQKSPRSSARASTDDADNGNDSEIEATTRPTKGERETRGRETTDRKNRMMSIILIRRRMNVICIFLDHYCCFGFQHISPPKRVELHRTSLLLLSNHSRFLPDFGSFDFIFRNPKRERPKAACRSLFRLRPITNFVKDDERDRHRTSNTTEK